MISRRLREAAQRFGDRVVVQTTNDSLTYKELDDYADACALALISHGVEPGHVVSLCLPSGPNWLIAAVASNRIGAIFAGVSPVLSETERASVLKVLRPQVTIASPATLDGLPLRLQVAIMSDSTHLLDDAPSIATQRERPLHLRSPDRISILHQEWPLDHPAVICLTSGTTGTPKAALFHNHQLAAIEQIDLGATQGIDLDTLWGSGSSMLASTQFAHVGMATKLPWYFRLGVTLHVMNRWNADDALRLIARHRITTLGTVAPQLALMLRSPLLHELDVSCVQRIIAGGAASSQALITAACEAFDASYSVRWSSTESGGVGLATPFERPEESLHEPAGEVGSIGLPRDNVEVRIEPHANDGSVKNIDTADRIVGELWLRSPAVFSEYYNNQIATQETLTDDRWLRTGDLAYQDTNGRYYIVGRLNDMYIRGGYNVFPGEVEQVLATHEAVSDIAIIAMADEVLGEIGVAVVVAAPDSNLTLESLRSFGEARLAKYKLPDRLVFINEIPLTAAQKPDRRAMIHMISSQIR